MPISNLLIPRILNRIRLLGHHEEEDIDVIRYSLEAIMWEVEKTAIMFLVFALLGYLNYYLIMLLVVFSIRPLSGGYHSETSLGCLIITFIWFFLSIVVLPELVLSSGVILIISTVSLLITFTLSPVSSLERESVIDSSKNTKRKLLVSTITFVWLFLILINQHSTYAYPALWIIALHNIQLLLEYFRRKRKKIC